MELEQVVAKAGKLYTLPDICLQLRLLTEDGQSSASEISRLVSMDTALSARLLKLANSSLYGFPSEVSSLPRAITLVGIEEMNNLALATAAAGMFRGVGGSSIDIHAFWRHSVLTGMMMAEMAKKLGTEKSEEMFLIGLLHNLGKLVILEQVAHFAGTACEVADPNQLNWEREREVLGYTFSEVGAELMKVWGMPKSLLMPMTWQHLPLRAPSHKVPSVLLHIALNWVGLNDSEREGEGYVKRIDPNVIAVSKLKPQDFHQIFKDTEECSPEVLMIFP